MSFENKLLPPEELPELEEVDFTGLEKDFLYMRVMGRVIFFFITGIILTIWSLFGGLTWYYWLLPWAVLLIGLLVLDIKGFAIKGYAIRSKDISYKSGLIFFTQSSIPFNRIQHSEISQGPLGRLFDLASVRVYTAGGGSSDMVIQGLHKERAQKLRDYITKLSSEYE
mgnify:CR=1 FL=1